MEKLKAIMSRFFDRLDKRWRALTVRRQRRYTLYFFIGYVLLTIGVIFNVWCDSGKNGNGVMIEHIENPLLEKKQSPAGLQDTLTTILKNKFYERK